MREYRSYLVAGSEESEEPLDNVLKILPPVVLNSKRGFCKSYQKRKFAPRYIFGNNSTKLISLLLDMLIS